MDIYLHFFWTYMWKPVILVVTGATPPRDPNSDTVEVEDMELSDEEDDRRRGSIIGQFISQSK